MTNLTTSTGLYSMFMLGWLSPEFYAGSFSFRILKA